MIEDTYPVRLDVVDRPERFRRSQVLLRGLVLIAVSLLAMFAWLVAIVYIAIPVVTAAFVSSDGRAAFREKSAPRLRRALHWIVAFDSYFTLLTDRMPNESPDQVAKFEVEFTGEPTTGSALLRLLMSIPSGIVLLVLSAVAVVTGIIAGASILITERYPDGLYRFHLGVVRWFARLLAYHASLVDEYPPFTLDCDPRVPAASTDPSSAPTSA
ncbi:MAG TPA: DUF4389 domain-containing protein [Dehalococcoidia bacterium]|nr:DUF4389 domain-containing protein [Dehalococcoidia bacterium]